MCRTKLPTGDRHRSTLGSLCDLAALLYSQGRLDEALPLLREALAAFKAAAGERHLGTLLATVSLANCLADQPGTDEGKQEAENLYRAALSGLAEAGTGSEADALATALNLASLLEEGGRPVEGALEAQRREALQRRATLPGRRLRRRLRLPTRASGGARLISRAARPRFLSRF